MSDKTSNKRRHGPRPVPVRCVETGEVFASFNDAADVLGLKATSLRTATNEGRTLKGLHFEIVPDHAGGFADDRGFRTAGMLEASSPNSKKPCCCAETGEVFESMRAAARAVGVTPAWVSSVLDKPDRTCRGLHFSSAPNAQESSFARPEASRARELSSAGSRITARKVRCVETGEVFESIASACRSTGAARSSMISALDRPDRTCHGMHFASVDGNAS